MPKRPLTWLITGCSSGFGLSLARLVQANGHNLIATSRNPARVPELVAEVEQKGGKWLALDVNDQNSGQVIEELEAGGQAIDVLVNNAGYCVYAPAECLAEDEVRGLMETAYFGPYRLIRAVLPHMRARRFGVVVNVSSGAALDARDSMAAYGAAKAALDALSRTLVKEVSPFNIRVLTVQPGTFNTNMFNATILGRNALPDDYRGSVAEQTMRGLASGAFQADGDKDKAMRAVYELVVGEGVGAGRESERLLPLGRDLVARLKGVQEYYAHALEVFGDVCNNVYRDGR
ncbi:uncharacterized protein THITE_42761 [Thermothielavioides terrestris NRRL 8126]|uniref:Uncharacterized protein n=2 Tax=Thermothielavioides terrestris TaxID=2587410 RepID=G2RBB8_THETT|nr:uncharacterized protein THITE_42761 [Thermothielavioides terrestris NRRL 8126]AEO69089.1 hypothetical protein THITE_42761 [Thermothielavioides terrestris NRRL 8126]